MKGTSKKKHLFQARLLSVLLALLLLAGCGGGSPSGGDADESQSSGDVSESFSGGDSEESQPGGDVHRNPPGGSISEPDMPRPVIGLTRYTETHDDDDLGTTVNRMDTELPGADADTHANYPELADALDRFREDALSQAWEGYQEREEWLPDFIETGGNGGSYEMYGGTYSMIRRADSIAASVVNMYPEYSGGTHANLSYSASNFDTDTGEEIALETLLTDEGAEMLNARIGEELDALYPDFTPGEQVAAYAPEDYTFSLEPDGVTFWFNPGEVTSYVHGLLTVKLYFIRDGDILDDTYESAYSSWFVEFGNEIYRFTADNGEIQTVETWPLSTPSWDANGGVAIEFDAPNGLDRWDDRFTVIDADNPPEIPEGRTIVVDSTNSFNYHTFYAHIPFGDYVVVILDVGEGNQDILVYSSSGEFVQRMDRVDFETFFYPEPPEEDEEDSDWEDFKIYQVTLTNPDDTRFCTYAEMFGAWGIDGNYRLTGGGFQLQQEMLYTPYGEDFPLTFLQDFTVARCDPDDWFDVTDEEITIPEGTEVALVAINQEQTTAYFRVPDAEQLTNDDMDFIFALSYDDGEEGMVNGILETDLFDGILYAG